MIWKPAFSLRVFIAYFSLIGIAGYGLFSIISDQIKPTVRQATEDALVETANLLAEIVAANFQDGGISGDQLDRSIQRFLKRRYRATIYSVVQYRGSMQIYITDDRGIVLYNSTGRDLGADYSRWNDVYLTLRGQYGARSTPADPKDPASSVMYVAAPILKDKEILGVLTVAKPAVSTQAFINLARRELTWWGIVLLLLSIGVGALLSIWLSRSIRRLVHYARAVAHGEAAAVPEMREPELNSLAQSMFHMSETLKGKQYLEDYVHSLTHELKSPVAAIQGAAELIGQGMSAADLRHFSDNIQFEARRMNEFLGRLLDIVRIENLDALQQIESLEFSSLLKEVVTSKSGQAAARSIHMEVNGADKLRLEGEAFLLRQALENLLNNALDFSPDGSVVRIAIEAHPDWLHLRISDQGCGIPAYALGQVYDRFYSLPRPADGKRSSGLGLTFVQQVALLHGGRIELVNQESGGVRATFSIPRKQARRSSN